MVDFQSRDTRRDLDDEADDDGDEAPSEEAETENAEPTETPEEESVAIDGETTEYGPKTLPYAVVTVADDRTIEADAAGAAVVDAIEHAGDAVATRELVSADYDGVQSTVGTLARRGDVAAIVTVGGVGVSPDDVTVDAVEPLFDKDLPGFGELYRVLSHDFDGTSVVRTRVTAGIVDGGSTDDAGDGATDAPAGVPVFCLPDDTAGARRGVEQIVLEEAETIVEEAGTE
jgi:molybdenum cofactor biosynthesis protein B